MTHEERLLEYAMIYLAEHLKDDSVRLEMLEVFVAHPDQFFSTAALRVSRMSWFVDELALIAHAMKFQESRREDWTTARRKALMHMVETLARDGYFSIDAIASITGHNTKDFEQWLADYEQKHGRYRGR